MMLFFGGIAPGDRQKAEDFAVAHPFIPVVASAEGRILCVRRTENRYSRQDLEAMFAGNKEVRCPEITGYSTEPRVIHHNIVEKAVSFVKAVTSGTVNDDVFNARLAACESCKHLRRDGEKLYCGGCGCGRWKLSELHTKLRFANLKCPLKIW